MTAGENRAARRARERGAGRRARTGLVAVATAASMGVAMAGGIGVASADSPLSGLDGLGGLDGITDLLDNEMITDFIEICDDPDGSTPVPEDGDEVYAVVDCSQSTGTGIAVVLPESVEVGIAGEKMDPISIPLYGENNLVELASRFENAVLGVPGSRSYKSYAEVQRDAALPVEMITEEYCSGVVLFGRCVGGSWKTRTLDKNLKKRTEALKIAEYFTGYRYDYSEPIDLPGLDDPRGTATVAGPGIQLALAMGGGNAYAETAHELGAALAGASGGRDSSAYSFIGLASALNADTDELELTWFGQELNFDKLKSNWIVDLLGGDNVKQLDEIENLEIPALKEVSCFGMYTTATAEDLGECTNVFGTFDYYKDLRPAKDGESRQTQYGLTDLTSLFFGPDALLKQIDGSAEETPFLDGLMDALTDEDVRLKFANDFLRLTRDVRSEVVMVPELDEDGEPVLEDGEPVLVPELDEDGNEVLRQVTATFLTSDYGLVEPVAIDWMGYRMVLFPAVEVNGEQRPNLLSLPQIEKILDGETDEDGEDEDGQGSTSRSSGLGGLLPTVSLVSVQNPFGLGTLTLDKPFDLKHTWDEFRKTVTIGDDLEQAGDLIGDLTGSSETEEPEDPEVPETQKKASSSTEGDDDTGSTGENASKGGDDDSESDKRSDDSSEKSTTPEDQEPEDDESGEGEAA